MASLSDLDELAALRSIVEGTATETGESFFSALVTNLSRTMGTMGAWIALYSEHNRELVAVSMKMRDEWLDGFSYPVEGTPCQTALDERRTVHIPDRIVDLYRGDPSLRHYGAVSYMGVPLLDVDGAIIGQLAVLDDKPMPPEPRGAAIFQIFANRASAELRRLRAERATREREAQLSQLLGSAMDAIVVLDDDLRIVLVNSAAARAFELDEASCPGRAFRELVEGESADLLRKQASALVVSSGKDQSSWIAGGLRARSAGGRPFHAEATLSHYRAGGRGFFTLILRDVEERIAAEERIRSLTRETELLRRELGSLRTFDPILGSSKALLDSLAQVGNVAATDATVLLLGETGTGKELFAEAIHAGSKRADRPVVRVNCGAIPANLIESELFGHEKGAFTGAIQRRDGRFTLADGGTLFLDEIGELPLELQPKLLRVLQTGELEPVGSAKTIKVDVRIIAATHRDLRESVKRGTFREDLFYRLDVFPISIPPLRERRDDIPVLAQAFAEKFAKKLGRRLAPLSAPVLERLQAYPWPGNVRELENVVERGVILSTRGVFEIDRALPSTAPPSDLRGESSPALPDRILTADELLELERANIQRALEAAAWKVAGPSGAAALLGMNASTLSSRMRALGIRRPGKA
ncbi:MAG: sigma 54-interacting transcriptional regulator [Polyangiaceae bacterium]|nr:sigma 54-interacting transcriptional regulator [Polyangiaceae bacterium]MCE7888167.1 PAS domain S-box protein [Sorangiineae bacterium PRO1]MCL4756098.1 sigma 54-interacting transcriptional regulator [Myxococcales bacterium]